MTRQGKKVKALYPHPFPEFKLDPEKWLGVSFGADRIEGTSQLVPVVGFVFAQHEYAAKIHSLVLSWTQGKHADEEKYIRVAVIEDTDSSYIFFCHPNFHNPTTDELYKQVEEDYRDQGIVPEREAAMLFLGKRCDIGPGSRYKWFLGRYQQGVPVKLEFSVANADGSLSPAEGATSIVVFDVLFSKKDDLGHDDPLLALLERGPFDHSGNSGSLVN